MGLKDFSRVVWMKVMEKRETDYHEVAEDMLEDIKGEALTLAREQARAMQMEGRVVNPEALVNPMQFDERNVRRRVYDALNVMMAVGVIDRDRAARKIYWRGLEDRSKSAAAEYLERVQATRQARVVAKRRVVKDLLQQQIALRVLMQRNRVAESCAAMAAAPSDAAALPRAPPPPPAPSVYTPQRVPQGSDASAGGGHPVPTPPAGDPSSSSSSSSSSSLAAAAAAAAAAVGVSNGSAPGVPQGRLHLPFVVVTTDATATALVHRDEARHNAVLAVDRPFQVIDHKRVLEALGLAHICPRDIETLVPAHLRGFLTGSLE